MFSKMLMLYFLFLRFINAQEEDLVYEYNANNFKYQIEEMDGNFVMFYAPWCRHCTEFHPIWLKLAEEINTKDSKLAIAKVDCTIHSKLCQENDITGYPTLLYFHKNTFTPVEYKGSRDLPSLQLFLNEISEVKIEVTNADKLKDSSDVTINSGMAYLNDQNIEKFVSKGQHFIMFFAPWCKASQKLAPTWAELATQYSQHNYVQIGKVNCMDNEITCKNFDINQYPYLVWIADGRISGVTDADTLEALEVYVEKMLLTENHDPDKFLKKKKVLPIAKITEETFERLLENDLVFINYYAPWCAHCMQLKPLWLKLGERFQNESRVLIADVDCVRYKLLCEMEKINALPTLILYKYGKIVNIEHGGRPLESLISLVTEQLQETNTSQHEGTASIEDTTQTKDEL